MKILFAFLSVLLLSFPSRAQNPAPLSILQGGTGSNFGYITSFNSDWNMVGDSHANIFAQYTPTITITGTGNTNGTTTVSNVVLSAQPQPGAGVWGASFGTFNTWIAPGGVSGNCLSSCTLTLTAVATATATGTAVNVQMGGSYLDLFIYIGFDTSSSQVGTATLAVHNCEVHRTDTF